MFLFLIFLFFGNLSPLSMHMFVIVEISEQYYKTYWLSFSLVTVSR